MGCGASSVTSVPSTDIKLSTPAPSTALSATTVAKQEQQEIPLAKPVVCATLSEPEPASPLAKSFSVGEPATISSTRWSKPTQRHHTVHH